MLLVSFCSCLWPIHWSQVLSRKWRYSWSSADRRCPDYIWVNNFIVYSGASYIRGFTVNHSYFIDMACVLAYLWSLQCRLGFLDKNITRFNTWREPDRCRPTSVDNVTMGCCSAAGCRQPHRKPHRGDRNRSVCFVLSRLRSLRRQSNRFVKFLGNFLKHVLTTKSFLSGKWRRFETSMVSIRRVLTKLEIIELEVLVNPS